MEVEGCFELPMTKSESASVYDLESALGSTKGDSLKGSTLAVGQKLPEGQGRQEWLPGVLLKVPLRHGAQ